MERDPRAVPTVTVGTRWGRLDVGELVMAVADGPVVAMGPHCKEGLRRSSAFYACVDGSTRAEAVLDVVAAFAPGTRAGAFLLTVMTGGPSQPNAVELERLCTGYLARLSRRLERSGVPCNWDVLHDADPARSIVEYVASDGVVALTSHGTSDRTGGLGPVARRVVRLSGSPVLVLSAPPPPRPPARPQPRRRRPASSSQRDVRSRTQRRTARVPRSSPDPPVCPECGTDGLEHATFCGHCGHHLGATTGTAAASQHLDLRP